MALSLRTYLFESDGAIKRIPRRVVEGLIFGKDAMPQYAGTIQQVVAVLVESEIGKPVSIRRAEGSFWTFDAEGKIDEGLRRSAASAMDNLSFGHPTPENAKVVSLGPAIGKRHFRETHRWEPSQEQLDWMAADVFKEDAEGSPAITTAKGTTPKRPPLTFDAKEALFKVKVALSTFDFDLTELSEPALKGLAFEARRLQAEYDEGGQVWLGIAEKCDHQREIKARHRTGKGMWYAVVEAWYSRPGSDRGDLTELAFEKCTGKTAAVEAARKLLAQLAAHFDENTTVEPRIYCELEWEPED